MSDRSSKVVERLLAERIGLDPSSVGEGLIARGVHARMAALGLRDRAEYERALLESGDELQALVEEVIVAESWFFRDDRPFEILASFASAGWLTDLNRSPLSALSIPCAGGEEPYSIAMTLLETGLPGGRFRVDAADISARNLARAIAGVYNSNSFRGAPSALRSTYFREQSGSYTLGLAVRSTVHFHLGNLLDPALFADRPPFDVVFCRNLLIYLDIEARARAFATLARLIVDGGLLFLGHADRIEQPEGSPFEATGDKGSFAYRKGGVKPKLARAQGQRHRDLPPSPLAGEGRGGGTSHHQECSKKPVPKLVGGATPPPTLTLPRKGGGDQKGEPGLLVAAGATPLPSRTLPRQGRGDQEEKSVSASTAASLDRASSLADQGRYDEATALVEGVIRDGGASARAYFLLGLIAQASRARGASARAEAHYLKAIYLDPQHDEALLALALLARRKGDIVGEATYRRRAERVLARKVAP